VKQESLLTALEPINPRGFVTRMPGIDAPCICQRRPCGWPFCFWNHHLPVAKQSEQEDK
jgi:hypothetical protein